MSDTNTESCHKDTGSPAEPEATMSESAEVEKPRRSERVRTLTEKGKELEEEKLKTLQRLFKITH